MKKFACACNLPAIRSAILKTHSEFCIFLTGPAKFKMYSIIYDSHVKPSTIWDLACILYMIINSVCVIESFEPVTVT